ncbi:MAG: hypothetical protein GY842_17190 [bacterium]|nr:hypothetical protein [bacterium]
MGLRFALIAAALLGVLAVLEGGWRRRRRWTLLATAPEKLTAPLPSWGGLRMASGAVGVMWSALFIYWMAVPPGAALAGRWGQAVACSVAAVVCAVVILSQVGRAWSVSLACVALGLLTLTVFTLAVAPVRREGQWAPLALTALVMASGLMTWFWSWIAEVWRQQLYAEPVADRDAEVDSDAPECGDHPRAWTTAGRLVPVCECVALTVGGSGVVLALLLIGWPIVVAQPPDAYPWAHTLAGVFAHLLLLLSLLRVLRGRRGLSIIFISVVVLSMIVFVATRAGLGAS